MTNRRERLRAVGAPAAAIAGLLAWSAPRLDDILRKQDPEFLEETDT